MPTLPQKRPATLDDLSSCIASAAAANRKIRILGSGSCGPLNESFSAHEYIPIATTRLNKIIEHAVLDMTVIVQAGITLEALQTRLAFENQWLPVDAPALGRPPASRTLGGLVATNALGPLRLGFGDWRSLILGMRWVDAAGNLIKSGGRTVKNVAGYASHRLLIGSQGSLGAIAELTLRTYARPPDERSLLISCSSAQEAEEMLAAIFTSATQPAYVQALGGQGFPKNSFEIPAAIMLVAGFLDREEYCAAQIATLQALPALQKARTSTLLTAPAGRLRRLMTAEPAMPLAFHWHLPSSRVAEAVIALQELAQRCNTALRMVAEAAPARLRAAVVEPYPDSLPNFWDLVRQLAAQFSAEPQLMHASDAGISTPPISNADIYSRIKSELDPSGIFPSLLP